MAGVVPVIRVVLISLLGTRRLMDARRGVNGVYCWQDGGRTMGNVGRMVVDIVRVMEESDRMVGEM